jgi:transcriptional regulator with XRE-family HTH domain
MTAVGTMRTPVGTLLREWRERRRLSQLALAERATVSPKHLSFIETGRSRPSPEMVLHLAGHLEVPLRHRNELLLAAGYAPRYTTRSWEDAEFGPIRRILGSVLSAHEPAPALVVDRHWNLLAANRAVALLTDDVAPELLEAPVNVVRVCMHPRGLARRIVNLDEWAAHVIANLAKQLALTADPELRSLHDDVVGSVAALGIAPRVDGDQTRLAVPMRLRTGDGEARLLATIATFGTAVDATLSELTVEAFLPADEATASLLARRMASYRS